MQFFFDKPIDSREVDRRVTNLQLLSKQMMKKIANKLGIYLGIGMIAAFMTACGGEEAKKDDKKPDAKKTDDKKTDDKKKDDKK